jgi:hypothetical protein
MHYKMKQIVEKWAPMLEGLGTDEMVKSTAQMLENQSRFIDKQILGEAGLYSGSTPTNASTDADPNAAFSSVGDVTDPTAAPTGIARYKQIAIPMVRRIFPELLAHKLVGVQPMAGPVGLAYAVRFRASTAFGNYDQGTELGYNNIDETYTSATTAGGGYSTEEGEQLNEFLPNPTAGGGESVGNFGASAPYQSTREVGMTIEQKEIVARTRKLKARWTIEVEQDLSAMHNLDFEEEIMDLMAYEIAQEIDRELVARIKTAAKAGGQFTWNYGTIGVPSSGAPFETADGRWQQEKFRTLYTTILTAAEEIGRATRQGPGNYIIVSPKVAVALQSLPDFAFAPVSGNVDTLKFGVSEVGTLGNGIKVYRDTFAYGNLNGGSDFIVVGFKGGKESETGLIYCPYIPVMFQKAIGQESFSPRAGVMTRYGIVDHLYGSHNYYRYIAVDFGEGITSTSTGDYTGTFTAGKDNFFNSEAAGAFTTRG